LIFALHMIELSGGAKTDIVGEQKRPAGEAAK
jgi:hypothetical protein